MDKYDGLRSLVVTEKNEEGTWEDKTWGSIPKEDDYLLFNVPLMAGEGDLVAVAWGRHRQTGEDHEISTVVAFWQGGQRLADVILPEGGQGVAGIVLEESKLVLDHCTREMRVYQVSLTGSAGIRLDLIKRIKAGSSALINSNNFFSNNKTIFGRTMVGRGVFLFETKKLPDLVIGFKVLQLPKFLNACISFNYSQIVFVQNRAGAGPGTLYVKDFWMGNQD